MWCPEHSLNDGHGPAGREAPLVAGLHHGERPRGPSARCVRPCGGGAPGGGGTTSRHVVAPLAFHRVVLLQRYRGADALDATFRGLPFQVSRLFGYVTVKLTVFFSTKPTRCWVDSTST